jgi:hypothetical protein
MWDEVKNPSSRRRTNSLTRRHAMKGNGTNVKTLQKGKNPNNFKKNCQKGGFFKREPTQGGC